MVLASLVVGFELVLTAFPVVAMGSSSPPALSPRQIASVFNPEIDAIFQLRSDGDDDAAGRVP